MVISMAPKSSLRFIVNNDDNFYGTKKLISILNSDGLVTCVELSFFFMFFFFFFFFFFHEALNAIH